jgi:hypothetical protein
MAPPKESPENPPLDVPTGGEQGSLF